MEPVHIENDSENTQGFHPSVNPELEPNVILSKVTEKLKVAGSPPETECGSTTPGIVLGESDSQGSGLTEAIISEDLTDLSGNSAIRSKKYSRITDEQRRDFIDAVENNGEKIIHAAKRFKINYSSAKSILSVFKSEGRSLKKMTRNRDGKDEDGQDIEDNSNSKPQEISGSLPVKNQVQKVTNEVSTQTCLEDEPQQEENYLLALRDRLLASKSEKRENPYLSLISHEATRYPKNLKENPQHQQANSGLSSYISLQGTPGSQNSTGETKYFATSEPMQQYLSGIQAQYYQKHYQLGLSQQQDPRNNLNMGYPAQQQSGNNFSSMPYTGLNQAQYTMNQANDNQKDQIQYIQPIMYVMPSSVNQLNFNSPIYQNIQNYTTQQNMYLYYGQNQNQEEGQSHNSKRG